MSNESVYECAVLDNCQTLIYQKVFMEHTEGRTPTRNEVWKNPLFVGLVRQQNDKPQVQFHHLALFSKDDTIYPIDPRHILCKYEPEQDLKRVYQDYVDRVEGYFNGQNN